MSVSSSCLSGTIGLKLTVLIISEVYFYTENAWLEVELVNYIILLRNGFKIKALAFACSNWHSDKGGMRLITI